VSRHLRLSLAIALVLLAAFLGYYLTRSHTGRNVREATQPPAAEKASPGATAIGESTIRHSPGGRTAWQVKLDDLQLESGGGSVAAKRVREALIYNESGKPMVRLTAQRVSGNTRSRNLEVAGSVRAVSPEGAVFDSELVRWVQDQQKLVCPGRVTMRNKDTVIGANSCDFFVTQDLVKCPTKVQMVVGNNTLVGFGLNYNIKSEDFSLQRVQAIFSPEAARKAIGR